MNYLKNLREFVSEILKMDVEELDDLKNNLREGLDRQRMSAEVIGHCMRTVDIVV